MGSGVLVVIFEMIIQVAFGPKHSIAFRVWATEVIHILLVIRERIIIFNQVGNSVSEQIKRHFSDWNGIGGTNNGIEKKRVTKASSNKKWNTEIGRAHV